MPISHQKKCGPITNQPSRRAWRVRRQLGKGIKECETAYVCYKPLKRERWNYNRIMGHFTLAYDNCSEYLCIYIIFFEWSGGQLWSAEPNNNNAGESQCLCKSVIIFCSPSVPLQNTHLIDSWAFVFHYVGTDGNHVVVYARPAVRARTYLSGRAWLFCCLDRPTGKRDYPNRNLRYVGVSVMCFPPLIYSPE